MSIKKIKICLICDTRSIHFQRWIQDLQGLGHKLYIISPWKSKVGTEHIEFVPTPKASFLMSKSIKNVLKMIYRIKLAQHVKKKLKYFKPDLVHAHFVTDSGWIGAWTNFHPFIVTAHGSDILKQPQEFWGYRLGNSFVIRRADKVIMVAKHMKHALIKLGCSEEKLYFIPNYADEKFIIPEANLFDKIKNLQSNPTIISARNLEPVYNIETLIRAAKHVVNILPNAQFKIIGDGTEYDKLKTLSTTLNLNNNIKFIGHISHDELVNHMKGAHIYISTALSDGLSVTTLEGLASGTFPILTDIPSNTALFEQGAKGARFPVKDDQLLGKHILNTINNPDMADCCLQNINFIKNNFTQDVVLNNIEKLYYDTISQYKS